MSKFAQMRVVCNWKPLCRFSQDKFVKNVDMTDEPETETKISVNFPTCDLNPNILEKKGLVRL